MPDSLVNGDTRRLGTSGPEIGPLAYGCRRFTTDDIAEAVDLISTAPATRILPDLDHGPVKPRS